MSDETRIWFRIPGWLADELDRSARENERSRSAEIRQRLKRDLKDHPAPADGEE